MSPKLGFTESDLKIRFSEQVQDLKKKLRASENMISQYRVEHGSISTLFDAIKDAIVAFPKQPLKYRVVGKKRVESPCAVCVQITDTHYGAVQDKSEVEGFGSFSPEICERRSMEFINKVLNWTDLHRSNYKLDRVHVLVTGDLISGDIHQELLVTNAFPSPVQTVGSARVLASQISMLSQHFQEVVVHFIVEDNHARLTKKPQCKEAGFNSFNYIVGNIAKIMIAQQRNVKFNIYPQYEVVVNVEGRRYLLTHGHGVMGWMGFPYYGVERKIAREAIKRMNGPDVTKFHKVIMGHWHAPLSHPLYWIGGSLQGTDAFDHKCGRHAEPSQAAWCVHPKHGEFDRTDFVFSI